MATTMQWTARFVDTGGAAVSGLAVDVELFNLDSATWETEQTLTSGGDGRVAGSADLADDTIAFAPSSRLVEHGTTTVLSSTPQIARTGRPPVLSVDFGEITHLPVAAQVAPIGSGGRMMRAGAFTIGGIASPVFHGGLGLGGDIGGGAVPAAADTARIAAVDPNVLRAAITDEVSRSFSDRLTDSARIIADKDNLIAARQADIADRDAKLSDANARIAALSSDNARLQAAAAAPSGPAQPLPLAPVPMRTFATSIATDLHSAQDTLASRAFSIGRIEVNARALLGNDGTVALPGQDSTVDPARLSDVKLEFQPDATSGQDLKIAVPDVAQLTESAARRVIASVGLQMQASYGPKSMVDGAVPGQTMMQTPRGGELAPRGAQVLVVFASE